MCVPQPVSEAFALLYLDLSSYLYFSLLLLLRRSPAPQTARSLPTCMLLPTMRALHTAQLRIVHLDTRIGRPGMHLTT